MQKYCLLVILNNLFKSAAINTSQVSVVGCALESLCSLEERILTFCLGGCISNAIKVLCFFALLLQCDEHHLFPIIKMVSVKVYIREIRRFMQEVVREHNRCIACLCTNCHGFEAPQYGLAPSHMTIIRCNPH